MVRSKGHEGFNIVTFITSEVIRVLQKNKKVKVSLYVLKTNYTERGYLQIISNNYAELFLA